MPTPAHEVRAPAPQSGTPARYSAPRHNWVPPLSFLFFSHPWQHLQRGDVEPRLLHDLPPSGLLQRLPHLYKAADAGQLPVIFSSHHQHRFHLDSAPQACRVDVDTKQPLSSFHNYTFPRRMPCIVGTKPFVIVSSHPLLSYKRTTTQEGLLENSVISCMPSCRSVGYLCGHFVPYPPPYSVLPTKRSLHTHAGHVPIYVRARDEIGPVVETIQTCIHTYTYIHTYIPTIAKISISSTSQLFVPTVLYLISW